MSRRRQRKRENIALTILILLLVLSLGTGAIWAVSYLVTEKTENTFSGTDTSIKVIETFDGTTKSNVSVKNTGSETDPKGPAIFVRVKLLAYWYEPDNERVAGVPDWTPNFKPGQNWMEKDGYYYYQLPINAGEQTGNLISSITLGTDAEGNRQVLEILAEGIQAVPENAAEEAWGITVSNNKITN